MHMTYGEIPRLGRELRLRLVDRKAVIDDIIFGDLDFYANSRHTVRKLVL